jgi:hypothetical protein
MWGPIMPKDVKIATLADALGISPADVHTLLDQPTSPANYPKTLPFPVPPLNDLTTTELRQLVDYLRVQHAVQRGRAIATIFDDLAGFLLDLERSARLSRRELVKVQTTLISMGVLPAAQEGA